MHKCLKNKIRQIGLSQAGVARLIELLQQVVCRWVNGQQVPASRVLQLCEIMAWTVTPTSSDQIFTLTQPMACLVDVRVQRMNYWR